MVSALALPSPAAAQYSAQPIENRAIGETYHVEISAGLWNPTPEIFVSSRAFDIIGTDIDAVNDLGVIQKKFGEFSLTLRPGSNTSSGSITSRCATRPARRSRATSCSTARRISWDCR